MSALNRVSEPYSQLGGMAAEGVRNLLGRPKLEPLELLVREAIQNSWDAKIDGSEQMTVGVAINKLSTEQRERLVTDVLPDPPPALPLGEQLARPDIRVLIVADRGTKGLVGEIRPKATSHGEDTDFVDFVRNIGQPPDREFGAGSFGYGKGAFYLLSRAATIIVHTHCRHHGSIESRLIACALGDHYDEPPPNSRKCTGRHWWGVIEDDGVVDPLIGPDADGLAEGIGLPPFAEGETGTTVAVVAPRLEIARGETDDREPTTESDDPRAAGLFIAQALAWNFWPKMIPLRGSAPAMIFSLSVDGEPVEIPDPDRHPRLQLFSSALRALTDDEPADAGLGGRVVETWCQRPRRLLGRVALRRGGVTPVPGQGGMPLVARAMETDVHHVALMRRAELVVKYEPGPPLPGDHVGYAGVFKCDEDVDEVFRQSEPPTHDEWEPRYLPKADRRLVNVALNRIRTVMEEFAAPTAARSAYADTLPIGEFSSQLAGLIPTLPGPGAAIPSALAAATRGADVTTTGASGGSNGGDGGAGGGGGGRSRARSRPGVEIVEHAAPVADEGDPLIRLRFRLRPNDARELEITARPTVMTLDGGSVEREAPAGAATPRVIEWIAPNGETSDQPSITVPGVDDGVWTLHVSHVADAVVRVELEVEPG